MQLRQGRVGSTYPFELLAGNHESYPRDGYYVNYNSCLPDHLSGVTGSYGQEYYVDYPAAAPLVRFVMISPNLPYGSSSATPWSYKSGTAHYTWTKNAIEGGKAKGLWVVAGMHEYCTSMVNYPCVVGSDIMNLMLTEKVDLLFQAHDHAYARSKQLTAGVSGCTSFPPTSYNAACVADQGATTYTKGKGTVVSTVGAGGKNMNSESPTVAQAPYFQTYEGNNQNATWGFPKVDVSPSQLSVRFVRGAGGTFADAYTVTNPSPNPPPTTTATTHDDGHDHATTSPGGSTTLAPVADTWVGSDATTTTHGSDTALYSVTSSSLTKISYLKFDLGALAGKTLTGASLKVTTTTNSSSGSPSVQNVYRAADTTWSESAMTYANKPALGTTVARVRAGRQRVRDHATRSSSPRRHLQSAVGGQLTLAVKGAAADTFYVNSKEAASARPQLVLTTG